MSDVKKLIVGIVFLIIAIFLLLGSAGGILPWLGVVAGLVGAALVIMSLRSGNLK